VGGRVATGWRMGSGGSLGVLASRATKVVGWGMARLLRDICWGGLRRELLAGSPFNLYHGIVE